MIQDAYLKLMEEAGFLGVVFVGGFLFACLLLLEGIGRRKKQRAIAEFRRQRRQHQADLTREREAHAAEVAALRERLRTQDDGPRPFDAIAGVGLQRTALMNRGEYRVFRLLQSLAPGLPGRPLVFPQVPIGEILSVVPSSGTEAQRRRAQQEIQCKRVDFALTDARGLVVAAVELQGGGHFQGNASWRDQVKQATFRRAGVPLIEVGPRVTEDDLRATLTHSLGRPPAPPLALSA